MFFEKLVLGPLDTNCYILSGDGKNALVIDPADRYPLIKKVLDGAGLVAEAVLITHGHLDHYIAVRELQSGGAPVYMNFADKCLIGDDFGYGYPNPVVFFPDKNIGDGEVLNHAGLNIKVIHTPGHTVGGVCFLTSDMLFSGDTLFFHYIGRTDLPTADKTALVKSIKEKLYILPPETRVFPGHDEETTIGYERKNNYYVKEEK